MGSGLDYRRHHRWNSRHATTMKYIVQVGIGDRRASDLIVDAEIRLSQKTHLFRKLVALSTPRDQLPLQLLEHGRRLRRMDRRLRRSLSLVDDGGGFGLTDASAGLCSRATPRYASFPLSDWSPSSCLLSGRSLSSASSEFGLWRRDSLWRWLYSE